MKLICNCGNEMEFMPHETGEPITEFEAGFEGVRSKIDSDKFHHYPYCSGDVELRCEKCGYAIWF